MELAETVTESVIAKTEEEVAERCSEFDNELSETLFKCEARVKEIEEVYRRRVGEYRICFSAQQSSGKAKYGPHKTETITQTRLTNDHLARILIHKTSALKSTYASSVSTIESLCVDFHTQHTLRTLALLPTRKSTSQLRTLRASYTRHLATHMRNITRTLSSARRAFDNGRRELVATKTGGCKDAWEVVRVSNGGKTDGLSGLDSWLQGFDDRVDECVGELEGGASKVAEEVGAHLEEVGIVEGVERMLCGMKVRVKAETIRCTTLTRSLTTELHALESYRDYDTLTWPRIEHLLTMTEHLRASAAFYAMYLGCLKSPAELERVRRGVRVEFGVWSEMRRRELVVSPGPDTTTTSPQTQTQAPQPQTPPKSARIKSAPKQRRPSSVASLPPTTTVPEVASPAPPPNGGSTTNVSATAPPKPATPGLTPSVRVSSPLGRIISDVPDPFTDILDRSRKEVRASIVDICETFFREEGARPIRRTSEIPPNAASYMGYIDLRLGQILEKAEELRRGHVDDFTTFLTTFSQTLQTLTTKTLSTLLTSTLRTLTTHWHTHTSTLTSLPALRGRLHALRANLQLSLRDRVDEVDREAQGVLREVGRCYEGVRDGWRKDVCEVVGVYVERVEFVTEVVAGVVDGVVAGGDVVRPQAKVEPKARTVREILEDMRRQEEGQNEEGQKAETGTAQIGQAASLSSESISQSTVSSPLALSDLPIKLPYAAITSQHRSTPLHTHLYAQRDATFRAFCTELNQKWAMLEQFVETERAEDQKWEEDWRKAVNLLRDSGRV
ncbi:hypothetical protein HK104_003932 [Borealophlyctis nickersoniae]|nr:hypothetical protein HK104_003932 [Borealophlyctis nickersoniae]